jgi:hypothetical protein
VYFSIDLQNIAASALSLTVSQDSTLTGSCSPVVVPPIATVNGVKPCLRQGYEFAFRIALEIGLEIGRMVRYPSRPPKSELDRKLIVICSPPATAAGALGIRDRVTPRFGKLRGLSDSAQDEVRTPRFKRVLLGLFLFSTLSFGSLQL